MEWKTIAPPLEPRGSAQETTSSGRCCPTQSAYDLAAKPTYLDNVIKRDSNGLMMDLLEPAGHDKVGAVNDRVSRFQSRMRVSRLCRNLNAVVGTPGPSARATNASRLDAPLIPVCYLIVGVAPLLLARVTTDPWGSGAPWRPPRELLESAVMVPCLRRAKLARVLPPPLPQLGTPPSDVMIFLLVDADASAMMTASGIGDTANVNLRDALTLLPRHRRDAGAWRPQAQGASPLALTAGRTSGGLLRKLARGAFAPERSSSQRFALCLKWINGKIRPRQRACTMEA